MVKFRILEEARDFLFSKTMHTGSGAHPTSYSMGIGILYPNIKQLGCEVDKSPLPRPKLKVNGAISLLPLYVFMPWIGRTLPFYLYLSFFTVRYSVMYELHITLPFLSKFNISSISFLCMALLPYSPESTRRGNHSLQPPLGSCLISPVHDSAVLLLNSYM